MSKFFRIALMLSAGVFLSGQACRAQFPIEKGTIMAELTGETTLSQTTTTSGSAEAKDANHDIVVKFKAGYFLKENLVTGIVVIPSVRKAQLAGTADGVSRGVTTGLFARRYFPLTDRFAFLAQGLLEYGASKGKTTGSSLNIETRTTFMKLSGVVGAAYFLTPKIGLSTDFDIAGLRYEAVKVGAGGEPSSTLDLSVINKVPGISVRFTFLF